jgi:hypothetical protein
MPEVTGIYSSGFFEGSVIADETENDFPATGLAQVQWLNAGNFDKKGLLVYNADDANSLDYYLTFKLTSDSPEVYLPGWGTIAAPLTLAFGESGYVSLEDSIYSIFVYLKSNTPDSAAGFEVRASGSERVSFKPRRSGRIV